MKVLFPTVSVIMTSHMKSPYLPDAIKSVLTQTRLDIQVLLIDSGEWIGKTDGPARSMQSIYDRYHDHPLIEWITTGQKPGLIHRACPIAYVTNEVIRAGFVRGRYVCSFTDDDTYYPTYVEKMAGFLDDHPEHRAVWCSQDRVRALPDGSWQPAEPVIHADNPKYGASFDGQVDALQLMFHKSVLDDIGDPWLSEDPADSVCRHSDGLFMNRVGELLGVVPNVPEILVTHRYTPLSVYSPSG